MLGRFSFDEDTPGAQTPGLGAPSYAPAAPAFTTGAAPSFSTPSPAAPRTTPAPAPARTAPGAPARPAAPAPPDFTSMVSGVHAATDPVDQAQQHDALARQLFTSLQQQGHQVKWQGAQLIVDGRPYNVAGANPAGSTGSSAPTGTAVPRGQGIAPGAPAPGSYPNAGGGAITPQNVDSIQGNDPRFNTPSYLDALNAAHPEYGGGQAAADALWAKHPEWGTKPTGANTDPYGNVPGFDTGKLQDSTHANDKYIQSVRTLSQFVGSGGQVTRGHLDGLVAYAKAHGFANAQAVGDDKVDFGDGHGPIDVLRSDGALQFLEPWLDGGGAAPGAGGAPPLSFADALSSLGGPGGGVGGGVGVSGALDTSTSPAVASGFTPGQGPTYTPGDISFDDIPNLSYDDIYNSLTGPGNDTEQASDALLRNLLEHPESVDAHTLDTMKAKSKDEIAQQQQQEEQDLRSFGVSNGIDDSRWLQSERLASRRSRDNALVASNRDLELGAATTNTADKRAASQLGISYQGQKASQRQAAAALASDTTLRQSAMRGDRMALREQVNQKAAELGISKDQVMSQWLIGLADDATRRLGINVGAQIDMSKLNEQSAEFKEDLAFRLVALGQQDRQFGATYGLSFLNTQNALNGTAISQSQGK
jgi:hypothetical protein